MDSEMMNPFPEKSNLKNVVIVGGGRGGKSFASIQKIITDLAAYTVLGTPDDITAALAELRTIREEEEQGLRPVLPCKVGDTVYVDTKTFLYGERNAKRHAEALVTSFALGTKKRIKFRIFSPYVNQNKVFNYPLSAFGKTVFLTRDAATAALNMEDRNV